MVLPPAFLYAALALLLALLATVAWKAVRR